MYGIPFKKIIDRYSGTIYFPIEGDIEVLTIYYDYGYMSDCNTGYAHLLEHMIVKINAAEIEKICTEGVLFNAVTREYSTEYTFINLRGGNVLAEQQKKIEKLFSESRFGEKEKQLLSIEKSVIMEEYAILEKRFSAEEAMKMVGSKKQIEVFDIKRLAHVFEQLYKKGKSILLESVENIPQIIENTQYRNVYNFGKDILLQTKKEELYLRKCNEAKIITFFLHICCVSQISKKWTFEMVEEKNWITVKISGELRIDDKEHILKRYCLLCTSLKFYMEEIGWLIRNELLEVDIEKVFFENWEGIIYEY